MSPRKLGKLVRLWTPSSALTSEGRVVFEEVLLLSLVLISNFVHLKKITALLRYNSHTIKFT